VAVGASGGAGEGEQVGPKVGLGVAVWAKAALANGNPRKIRAIIKLNKLRTSFFFIRFSLVF
jgi:hypothetical protein